MLEERIDTLDDKKKLSQLLEEFPKKSSQN